MNRELKKRIEAHSYKHGFEKYGDIDVMMCSDAFADNKRRVEKDVIKLEDLYKILEELK